MHVTWDRSKCALLCVSCWSSHVLYQLGVVYVLQSFPPGSWCPLLLPPGSAILLPPLPLPLSVVAAIFTVHRASWPDSVGITFLPLFLCEEDRLLSIAGSKSPKVSPFGSCVFLLLAPCFKFKLPFKLPFCPAPEVCGLERETQRSE